MDMRLILGFFLVVTLCIGCISFAPKPLSKDDVIDMIPREDHFALLERTYGGMKLRVDQATLLNHDEFHTALNDFPPDFSSCCLSCIEELEGDVWQTGFGAWGNLETPLVRYKMYIDQDSHQGCVFQTYPEEPDCSCYTRYWRRHRE